MNEEELRQKCTERAKFFQQAMESCHSSNPMDCIEWFADRIAELEQKLEQTEKDLADYQFNYPTIKELEQENAELKNRNQELLESCEGTTMMYEHLTKAKELLKRYVPYRQITDSKAYKDLAEEAEQFLNSEVEK